MAGATPTSTHPPLPPTTEEDTLSRLRLLRSRRVGIATYWRLMSEHGSAEAALAALPDIASAAGITDYTSCPAEAAQAEMRAAEVAGARLLLHGDPLYPRDLAALSDAPPLLWMRGRAALLRRPMLAVVGARNASSLGLRMARRIAAELSEAGFVIVSGLARGIDAEAHTAALTGGTIAVSAGGVDVVYPPESADLTDRIAREGLVLSEQPMKLSPQARHFPARNRIVAGLSRGVVVVEAAARSGSLITARAALEAGRDVLAVPGHPFDARASGCNMLLRDGATLIRGARDVIDLIGPAETEDPPPPATAPATPPLDTDGLALRILSKLGSAPLAEDQLIRDLATPTTAIAPILMDLELSGQVVRQAGGLLARGDVTAEDHG